MTGRCFSIPLPTPDSGTADFLGRGPEAVEIEIPPRPACQEKSCVAQFRRRRPVSPRPDTIVLGVIGNGAYVFCVRYKKEMEGLDEPPFDSEFGQKIYKNVSKAAWDEWVDRQKMLLNEYRLQPWTAAGPAVPRRADGAVLLRRRLLVAVLSTSRPRTNAGCRLPRLLPQGAKTLAQDVVPPRRTESSNVAGNSASPVGATELPNGILVGVKGSVFPLSKLRDAGPKNLE